MRSACLGVALAAALACVARAEDRASPAAAPGRVLDLAFAGGDRVVALLADGVELHERDGASLRRVDHRPLDTTETVRAAAGLIVGSADEDAFWVGTNLAEGATLFTIDGGRLREAQRASALPFPGSAQGARFDPGTNLIDVTVAGLGRGPHLRAGADTTAWAIAPDGRLGDATAGWTATRVGSAAALLRPGTWAASSSDPPGAGDAISIVTAGDHRSALAATFPAPAFVTAIAARVRGGDVLIAAAVSDSAGHRLVLLPVALDAP